MPELFLVMTDTDIFFKVQSGEKPENIQPKGCVWIFHRKLETHLQFTKSEADKVRVLLQNLVNARFHIRDIIVVPMKLLLAVYVED